MPDPQTWIVVQIADEVHALEDGGVTGERPHQSQWWKGRQQGYVEQLQAIVRLYLHGSPISLGEVLVKLQYIIEHIEPLYDLGPSIPESRAEYLQGLAFGCKQAHETVAQRVELEIQRRAAGRKAS
jgi:hypothetical protein